MGDPDGVDDVFPIKNGGMSFQPATLPKTNRSPLKMGGFQCRNLRISQRGPIFRYELLVYQRVRPLSGIFFCFGLFGGGEFSGRRLMLLLFSNYFPSKTHMFC